LRTGPRSGRRAHPVSCGPIGVIGTKCPEPKATEVERDPHRGTHDREVQLRPDDERSDDGGEKRQALQRGPRIPMAEARDDGEPGGSAGAERPIPGKSLRAIDDLALERLDAKLGAAMRTEGGLGRHRAATARARLHAASVLALPTVAAPERSSVPVTIRILNGVAHVTLDRPPLNVLDIDTLRELNRVLRECAASTIRVLVLSSALPRAFSAGVDVADHVASRVDVMLAEVRENARLLLNLKPLTVAAIHGSTLGGGAEIALLCDIVIAANDTVLGFPEIKLAAFPPVAAACLPERCAWPLAMGLLLGETIDARAAQHAGLVSQVVEKARLAQTADRVATELAAHSAVALRALTSATRGQRAPALMQRLDAAIATYKAAIAPSRDADEGIRAFRDKRAPAWSHH